MKTLKEIANEILALKSAYVFCHVRPDGDTVGSAVALTLALRQKGIECDVVCDGNLPEKITSVLNTSFFLKPTEVKNAREGHIAVDVIALNVASDMLNCGASLQKLTNAIFKSQSKERSKLYIEVLNRMRFYLDNKLAIITVKMEDLQKYGLTEDCTEGFVDYPLTIAGVEVAVSLLQTKTNLYRVSIRTRERVNANAIADEFGGGGHVRAAGCTVKGNPEEIVIKMVEKIKAQL